MLRLVSSILCYTTAGTWHTEIKAVQGFGPALSGRTLLCHPLHAVIPPQPAGWLSPVSGWSFWRFYSSNPYSFLRTERLSLKLGHCDDRKLGGYSFNCGHLLLNAVLTAFVAHSPLLKFFGPSCLILPDFSSQHLSPGALRSCQ